MMIDPTTQTPRTVSRCITHRSSDRMNGCRSGLSLAWAMLGVTLLSLNGACLPTNGTDNDNAGIEEPSGEDPNPNPNPDPDPDPNPNPDPTCQPEAPQCQGDGLYHGCGTGFVCNSSCACVPVEGDANVLLLRPSRSTSVDITTNDAIVGMVNTDDGSVSFFNATPSQESRLARLATSRLDAASEPTSIVFHPDGTRAFVINRAAGTVSRFVDVNSASGRLDVEITLGGELVGGALSPTGRILAVTNWTEGTLSLIDTETMRELKRIELGGNPYGVAVTNDGDNIDEDERIFVTQFFARRIAGLNRPEGTDDGREGVVQVVSLDNFDVRSITLAPLAACFDSPDQTSGCFPNQLYGISIHRAFGFTYAYVVSVAASPAGPVAFNHNVQAMVSVIDVPSETEVPSLTTNLNLLIKEQQLDNDGNDNIGRRFINVPNAIDFVPRDDVAIGYVSSAGSDIVLRVEYTRQGAVSVGAPNAFNIPVGQNPQGIVIGHGLTGSGAYTANLITRDLSVISFRDQHEVRRIFSTPVPTEADAAAFRIWRGKRFFNTSTGIWSKEGWGSCQGCHPFGLSDGVTWKFAAGPRQTISLDGQYASNDPTDMRALNWTAVFDETTDFELNTRGVSGGAGALQNEVGPLVGVNPPPPFARLLVEDGSQENHQALNGSLTFVARNRDICMRGNARAPRISRIR